MMEVVPLEPADNTLILPPREAVEEASTLKVEAALVRIAEAE